GAVSGCLFVPWAVFSWRAVHAWLPRSGEAILVWNPSPWESPWTPARLAQAFRATIAGPAGDLANVLGIWPIVNVAMVQRRAVVIFVIFCVAIAAVVWSARRDRRIQTMMWVLVYAACHTVYYVQFGSGIRY